MGGAGEVGGREGGWVGGWLEAGGGGAGPRRATLRLRQPRAGCGAPLSSFVAARARVYSLARSNGCSAGSKFRGTCWRSPVRAGATEASVRLIVFIFIYPCAHRVAAVATTSFVAWLGPERYSDLAYFALPTRCSQLSGSAWLGSPATARHACAADNEGDGVAEDEKTQGAATALAIGSRI